MKIIKILIINILLFYNQPAFSDEENFNDWLIKFKKEAMSNNISESTFNKVMKDARYLPKVIEYDRYQPEFYEDTLTYISKRTSKNKVKKGIQIYNDNKKDMVVNPLLMNGLANFEDIGINGILIDFEFSFDNNGNYIERNCASTVDCQDGDCSCLCCNQDFLLNN